MRIHRLAHACSGILKSAMSCPLCGEVCRCNPESFSRPTRSRPRFEPEINLPGTTPRFLVELDTYDASEEQFAASLEKPAQPPIKPKFVVEEETPPPEEPGSSACAAQARETVTLPNPPSGTDSGIAGEPKSVGDRVSAGPQLNTADSGEFQAAIREPGPPEHDPGFWKQEVAARVGSFRARRKPRPPKYPSLHLKFEAHDNCDESGRFESLPQMQSVVMQTNAPDYENTLTTQDEGHVLPAAESARIIEFPRSYNSPVTASYELAEPVMDKPRIVEAPEIEPPPPALGGIILESEEPEPKKHFEVPLQTAPMGRRLLAGLVDGSIVLSASILFGYVFFRVTAVVPPLAQLLSLAAGFTISFWAAYQYLLLTYTGGTPGLKLAGLELRCFDGNPVYRGLRRWRVLASLLSVLSLGLGFAWCFLDEDALCWHDRITHTYLAAR
jgi:uncharacterized RDD family membrane protein YckC